LGAEGDPRTGTAAPSGEIRAAIDRLKEAIGDPGSGKATTAAMANLAEAIHDLVNHMRTEQQMIRDWATTQAEQQREVKRLLQRLAREDVHKI
jgi:gamma-glutamyl:cysteine ligase YbdK (ATP-grasp superfamily)